MGPKDSVRPPSPHEDLAFVLPRAVVFRRFLLEAGIEDPMLSKFFSLAVLARGVTMFQRLGDLVARGDVVAVGATKARKWRVLGLVAAAAAKTAVPSTVAAVGLKFDRNWILVDAALDFALTVSACMVDAAVAFLLGVAGGRVVDHWLAEEWFA